MSPPPALTPDLTRRVPPMGGFNLTFLGLEVRRMLRNRRTMIFTLIMPVVFYFTWARFTPAYGVGEIARAPLHAEAFDPIAVPDIIVWTILFALGATLLFRRDTRRV